MIKFKSLSSFQFFINKILTNKILVSCPLKLLKFHRTKWKKVQKLLKHLSKNSFKVKNLNLKSSSINKKINKTKKKIVFLKLKKKIKKFKNSNKNKVKFINILKLKLIFKRWLKLNKTYIVKPNDIC